MAEEKKVDGDTKDADLKREQTRLSFVEEQLHDAIVKQQEIIDKQTTWNQALTDTMYKSKDAMNDLLRQLGDANKCILELRDEIQTSRRLEDECQAINVKLSARIAELEKKVA